MVVVWLLWGVLGGVIGAFLGLSLVASGEIDANSDIKIVSSMIVFPRKERWLFSWFLEMR